MRRLAALMGAVVLAAALSYPAAAAGTPTGSFTLTGTFQEGATLTVTVTSKGVNNQMELTLGTTCDQPDGTHMLIGNLGGVHNPYIFELTSVRGRWSGPQYMPLWTTGTGYTCDSKLVAVLWQNGSPTQAWTLDEQIFSVVP